LGIWLCDGGGDRPQNIKVIDLLSDQDRFNSQLERANDLRKWVAQIPMTKLSLSDEACDLGSIYE
jgi:hypothetical protein